jgi:hypothetical protein
VCGRGHTEDAFTFNTQVVSRTRERYIPGTDLFSSRECMQSGRTGRTITGLEDSGFDVSLRALCPDLCCGYLSNMTASYMVRIK